MPWAARFLDQLGPHDPPTRRAYMDWVARTPGAPAASTLGRYGGHTAIMNKARQRRRAST